MIDMTKDLISRIGSQLNIPVINNNSICQIAYSVSGLMALSSLWDCNENDNLVSIQHFKNRITQIIVAYENIFPDIRHLFPRIKKDLVEDIYAIYLRTGFMYHSHNNLSPSLNAISGQGNIMLYRGGYTDAGLFMSGLGLYSLNDNFKAPSVKNMFGLQDTNFSAYLDKVIGNDEWHHIEFSDSTQYLRLDPPFSKGYWQQQPDIDGRISLARFGDLRKTFVIYKYDNGSFKYKQVPDWMIRETFDTDSYGEYRRLAIALIKQYENLPCITTISDGEFLDIKLGYRLPPTEEDFFKLYSWPLRYDFTAETSPVFNRKMSKAFYPLFKYVLESIGYSFKEE